MRSYYADFWQAYGVNPIEIWELPFDDFIPMTAQVDRQRREADKDRLNHG